MATVMDKEKITWFGGSDETGKGGADILASGLGIGIIGIYQDADVVLGESESVDQTLMHPFNVVDASSELGLSSWVIASDQHRLLSHSFNSIPGLCRIGYSDILSPFSSCLAVSASMSTRLLLWLTQ